MLWKVRFLIQNLTFIFLTYGGRIGIKLGHSLPCFSCPYVSGCAGHCYLMALQRSQFGFDIAFTEIFSTWGLRSLWVFVVFILFFIPFSKAWCGWICPFGTLQDWITILRKKMNIAESQFKWKMRERLKIIKYLFLLLLIILPICIANFGLHSDFAMPFCQICPAKPIMPLFAGQTRYLALDFTNPITLSFSILSMMIAGGTIAGVFFKDRFFCIFCPMLALMHIFRKIGFIRFSKSVNTCLACGNCQRMCPVDIKEVYLEGCKHPLSEKKINENGAKIVAGGKLKLNASKMPTPGSEKVDVMKDDCMLCLKCVEACPGDDVLSIKFFKFKLFSSSRKYVAEKWKC